MPKLYYPTPDELQGDQPLAERLWFLRYQHLLVSLANTDEGRDLLCIDPWRQVPYPVVAMSHNCVKFYLGRYQGRDWWRSDFRVGAKWGNVIRSRWRAIQKALDRQNLRSLLALPALRLPNGLLVPVVAGGNTTTVFPDPSDPGTNSVDGEILYISAGAGWATLHDAAAGTDVTSTAATANVQVETVATSPNFGVIGRGFFLFNTGDIGDTDTIDSATFSFTASSKSDQLSQSMALCASAPASSTTLGLADYDQVGGGAPGTVDRGTAQITIANVDALGTVYNEITLTAASLTADINKTGVSKFAVRCSGDLSNTAPAHPSAAQTARVNIKTADTAGTGADPKLVVTHTAPFIPKMAMVF